MVQMVAVACVVVLASGRARPGRTNTDGRASVVRVIAPRTAASRT
jgi:hypothetical protein